MTDVVAVAPRAGLLANARDDWDAAQMWLDALQVRARPVSQTTLANYTAGIERVRWYCAQFERPPLSRWGIDDTAKYLAFLRDESGKYLCPNRSLRPGDPGWTPFRRQLSPTAVANSHKILHALFSFWLKAGYVSGHPFAGIGGANPAPARSPSRRAVPRALVDLVLDVMEQRYRATDTDYLTYARDRFLIRLLERAGVRAEEAADAMMENVEMLSDPQTARAYWSLYIANGKGGRAGRVPLDDEVMAEFRSYRTAYGLPALPESGETNSLLLSARTNAADNAAIRHSRERRYFGLWRGITRRATVWDIVKGEFRLAADWLRQAGREAEAALIERASPHWLRHSTATNLVLANTDFRLVASIMRHKDVRTTAAYSELEFLDIVRALDRQKPQA